MATMKKLIEVKGISEAKAIKIQQSAMKLVPMGFTSVPLPQSLLIDRPPNTTRSAKTSSTSPRGAKNSTPFWVVAKQTSTITTRWNGNGIAN